MAKLKVSKNYGIIPNEILNLKEISFKAKGLFAYIQSKPDGWDFSAERISMQTDEGLASVRSGLKELEKYGLLIRRKYHNEQGFFETEYILCEQPMVENPTLDNPTLEKPTLENYINNSNKDFSKKEESNNFKSNNKKDIRKEFLASEFFQNQFENLWVLYGRKGSKKKAFIEASKLSEEDLKNFCEAEEHILAYVESTKEEPRYRKDFERYISNKYWESDIFKSQKLGKIGKTMQLYNNLINKDF